MTTGKFLIIILTIFYLINETNGLKCICNVCNEEDETCETSSSSESRCFKSSQKIYNEENRTYHIVSHYGCISGGDGFIATLQCQIKTTNLSEPMLMACCKDKDYCNEILPDPNEIEDPRWKIEPPNDLSKDNTNYLNINYIILLMIALVALCISILYLVMSINACRSASRSTRSSNDGSEKLKGSIFSSKLDLDKLGSTSAASTHSCSIEDDLTHEDTSIDLTSGLGERMLNPRTMARAVSCGKTDHVGNGRFGRVFRGQYHGEDVAVKAFRTIDQDSWKREETIFRTLNHENIVRFIASEVTSVLDTTEIWMFLEFCPYGSLCDYLDHNEILGQQQAIKILYCIINGLNYLHEDYAQTSRLYKPSIAHRDLKSKNILMRTPETCCIADFGHSLIKLDEDRLDYGYQHLQVGTIRYMAPEILKPNFSLNYRHFSTFAQADLYQYGLILWEVCHRTALDILHPAGHHKLPYDGVVPPDPHIQDMIKIVCDDQYRPPKLDEWDNYPLMKRLSDLMVECWRPNPKARMETLGLKKKMREIYDQVTHKQF